MTLGVGTSLQKFRIESLLGEASRATLYNARDTTTNQPVVVKVMSADVPSRSVVSRFARLRRISSHHVAKFIDVGTVPDGRPYVVMEKVGGTPLAAVPRETLPPLEMAHVLLQLCDAVGAAHAADVVHRRLTSQRVVVEIADGRLVSAKLLGFLGSGNEAEPLELADALFTAPEVLAGAEADRRSDVWSLGVVFYEALTGVRPFDAATVDALVTQSKSKRPRKPSAVVKAVPAQLDDIVLRCLAPAPEDRWESADALALELLPLVPGAAPALAARIRHRVAHTQPEAGDIPSVPPARTSTSMPPHALHVFDPQPDDVAAIRTFSGDGSIVALDAKAAATLARTNRVSATAAALASHSRASAEALAKQREGAEAEEDDNLAPIPLAPATAAGEAAAPERTGPSTRALAAILLGMAIVLGLLIGVLVKLFAFN